MIKVEKFASKLAVILEEFICASIDSLLVKAIKYEITKFINDLVNRGELIRDFDKVYSIDLSYYYRNPYKIYINMARVGVSEDPIMDKLFDPEGLIQWKWHKGDIVVNTRNTSQAYTIISVEEVKDHLAIIVEVKAYIVPMEYPTNLNEPAIQYTGGRERVVTLSDGSWKRIYAAGASGGAVSKPQEK